MELCIQMEYRRTHSLSLKGKNAVLMAAAAAVTSDVTYSMSLRAIAVIIVGAAILSLSTLQPQLSRITTVDVTARRV
jgi:hypothetical protein